MEESQIQLLHSQELKIRQEVQPEIDHLRYLIEEKTQEIRILRNENENYRMMGSQQRFADSANLPPKFDEMFTRSDEMRVSKKYHSGQGDEIIEYMKVQIKSQDDEIVVLRLDKEKDRSSIERLKLENSNAQDTIRELRSKIDKLEFENRAKNSEVDLLRQQETLLKSQIASLQMTKVEKIYEPVKEIVYEPDPDIITKNHQLASSLSLSLEEEKRLKKIIRDLEFRVNEFENDIEKFKQNHADEQKDSALLERLQSFIDRKMLIRSRYILRALVFRSLQMNADSCRVLRNAKKKQDRCLKSFKGLGVTKARNHRWNIRSVERLQPAAGGMGIRHIPTFG